MTSPDPPRHVSGQASRSEGEGFKPDSRRFLDRKEVVVAGPLSCSIKVVYKVSPRIAFLKIPFDMPKKQLYTPTFIKITYLVYKVTGVGDTRNEVPVRASSILR